MFSKMRTWQRLACLVLALGLIFTMVPASVFADETLIAGTTASSSDPAEEEEPAIEEEPAVEEEPVVEEEPAVEEEPVVEEEPTVEEEPVVSSYAVDSAPAAKILNDFGYEFIFSNASSDLVTLYYAKKDVGSQNVEFDTLPKGDSLYNFMTAGDVLCFYVSVPEGYEPIISISSSEGNIYAIDEMDAKLQEKWNYDHSKFYLLRPYHEQAKNNGCQWGFFFANTGDSENNVITIDVKPIVEQYIVSVDEGVLTAGAHFDDNDVQLPVTVDKGDSLTLTLYGPNKALISKLLSSLSINNSPLNIPLNTDGSEAITNLDVADVSVKYDGLTMDNGLVRAKYTITLSDIRGDVTFTGMTYRDWVSKGVMVNELVGISELQYRGEGGEWQSVEGNLPVGVPFFTRDALDILKGHYQIVNFRFKVAEDYSDPNLTLVKNNNETINKSLSYDAETGWYSFDITIGAVYTSDDIKVWFEQDEYYVNMRLTATEGGGTVEPGETSDAYFYLKDPQASTSEKTDYFFVGEGKVKYGTPSAGESYEVTNDNVVFPDTIDYPTIVKDGYVYEYATTGAAGTYSVEWKVVKAEYGATNAMEGDDEVVFVDGNTLTWHVDGEITLNPPIDIPDDVKLPEVVEVDTPYDGNEHKLTFKYDENFKVEYLVDGVWTETAPSQTNVGLQRIDVRFTYEPENDANVYKPYIVEDAQILVRPRTVYVKVDNKSKTVSGAMPEFTYTIVDKSAEEPDTGLLAGHEITKVVYSWDEQNTQGNHEIFLRITEILNGDTEVTANYAAAIENGTLTINANPGPNPTPDPTPNPTPVPTPVPETPVIPVAPVTPVDDDDDAAVVDDGEDAEDIEDEETPQASPEATPAPEATAEPEEIEDDATAQAGVSGWALINLILMVLTVLAGLVMLGLRFAGKSGALHLIGVVPALVALIAFFVTEDMSLPMVMTDRWTLIMALIAVVQIVLMVLGRHGQDNKDNANA